MIPCRGSGKEDAPFNWSEAGQLCDRGRQKARHCPKSKPKEPEMARPIAAKPLILSGAEPRGLPRIGTYQGFRRRFPSASHFSREIGARNPQDALGEHGRSRFRPRRWIALNRLTGPTAGSSHGTDGRSMFCRLADRRRAASFGQIARAEQPPAFGGRARNAHFNFAGAGQEGQHPIYSLDDRWGWGADLEGMLERSALCAHYGRSRPMRRFSKADA